MAAAPFTVWAGMACAGPSERRPLPEPGSPAGKREGGMLMWWQVVQGHFFPEDPDGAAGMHPAVAFRDPPQGKALGPVQLVRDSEWSVGTRRWSIADVLLTNLHPLDADACRTECNRLYATDHAACDVWCGEPGARWKVITNPYSLPAIRGTYRLARAPPSDHALLAAQRCGEVTDILFGLSRRQRDDRGQAVVDREGRQLWTFQETIRFRRSPGGDVLEVPNAFAAVVVEPEQKPVPPPHTKVTFRLVLGTEAPLLPSGEITTEPMLLGDVAFFARPIPTPTEIRLGPAVPGEECAYQLQAHLQCTAGAELPPAHYDDTVTGREVPRYCFPVL